MWRIQALLTVGALLLVACGDSAGTTTTAAGNGDGDGVPSPLITLDDTAGTTTTAAGDGDGVPSPPITLDDLISLDGFIGATAVVVEENGMAISEESGIACSTGDQTATCMSQTDTGKSVESTGADLDEDNATLVVRVDGEILYDGLLSSILPRVEPQWFGQTPPNGVLPDLSIPDHLYDTTGGASNFDQQSGVFETDGVWYLVGSWMESFIPVPSGWTTQEPGSNTLFMFSEELDLVIGFDSFEGTPEGYVLLGVDGFEGDDRSAQEALDSVVTEMADGGFEIMASEVVDDSRSYLVARQDSTLFLAVFSENPVKGWYHTLISVFDDRAQWDEYYPIVRAMIEGWYGLYDNPLGFSLPADLN